LRLATLEENDKPEAAIRHNNKYISLATINAQSGTTWRTGLKPLLDSGKFDDLVSWYRADPGRLDSVDGIAVADASVGPLYRDPAKIWGIGLNYADHAGDLDENVPEGLPGSFIKPATTIIGPGDTIEIPKMSERTTGEAELGIVFGKRCKDVSQANWLNAVAGFTTIIDMTAEDILRRNPRFLTICKSFDTFFVFGSELVTPDEIDDVMSLNVSTVVNGTVQATNQVRNMTYPPDYLVALHTEVMTHLPGDILSTGTPGAAHIQHGDVVECHIDGFETLACPVRDLKSE
jgi:2-keto-4-pentenoate hydratase/2-oxohepta-3-ene-1,7-dioic acid hydratase in catechol pathway